MANESFGITKEVIELASLSGKGIEYLYERMEKKIQDSKLERFDDPDLLNSAKMMLDKLANLVKFVEYQLRANAGAWKGETSALAIAFEKLQTNLAIESIKTIKEDDVKNPIIMNIAVKDGAVLREYEKDTKAAISKAPEVERVSENQQKGFN